jgi:DNA-directed RNA polymerase subunit H
MQNSLAITRHPKLNKKPKVTKMPPNSLHILQPKHTLLKSEESEKILDKFNISALQLPKIKITDPALPKGANVGDVIKIERKDEQGVHLYHRVVVL